MPPTRKHQPYINDIAIDESSLEAASSIVEKLDEADPKVFAASALYYLIERVVPIFRNWLKRIDEISVAHIADVQGHLKAKIEHAELRKNFHDLLVEVNASGEEPLIAVEPGIENPSLVIVRLFNNQREQLLQEHKIQIINIGEKEQEASLKLNNSSSILTK